MGWPRHDRSSARPGNGPLTQEASSLAESTPELV